ncbi:MAG: MFS transporter [Chloroflexi bacterium]|nr:MFS transporter [Chloroflexota bacterium]
MLKRSNRPRHETTPAETPRPSGPPDPGVSPAAVLTEGPIEASDGGAWSRLFGSLSIPGFRWLWFGTLFATAGMQMGIISQPWLAYHISGSATVLGLVALSRGLPMLVFSFIGGVAADRFDRRKLLITMQSLLGLLALTTALLVHTGAIQVWHLVALSIVQGTVFPFYMPTRQAIIPELVGQQRMGNAIALSSTGMNLNRVLAPTAAGLLLALNPSLAFYAAATFYTLSALTLVGLPHVHGERRESARQGPVKDMLVGLRYVFGQPVLATLMGLAFVVVLLGMPFQQFLPVFQADVLHVDELGLGLMYAFVGIGSLVGSLSMAYFAGSRGRGLVQIASGVGFGFALVLFSLSTTYSLSLAVLLLLGLASQGYMTINNVLIMENTNRALYGRVMSVYMMTWSLMPLSVLPMGALVDRVGAPMTVGGVGILLTAFFFVVALVRQDLWRRQQPTAAS